MGKSAPFQMDGGQQAGLNDSLLAALPEGITDNLTEEQRNALAKTLGKRAWGSHPLNIRLSFPFIGNRYYLAMVGGKERRSPKRVEEERKRHPVSTAANLLFGMGVTTILVFAAIVTMILQSAMSEY